MQQSDELVPLQDLKFVLTHISQGAYNRKLKDTQMLSLRADLEKKYVAIVAPCASEKSVQEAEDAAPHLQLQTNIVPSSNKMSRVTAQSAVVHNELLDKDAEIKCTNMPHEVQIEGITKIDGSTKIIGVPLLLEVAKIGCSTLTFAGQYSFEEFMNEIAHALAAPNIDVQVVQQNPCESESHIAI